MRPLFQRHSSPLGPSGRYQSLDSEDYELATGPEDTSYRSPSGLGLDIPNLPNSSRLASVREGGGLEHMKGARGHSNKPTYSYVPLSQSTTAQNTPVKIEDVGGSDPAGAESPFSPSREPYNKTLTGTTLGIQNKSPRLNCPTDGDILKDRWSLYTVPILILALYSTVFSGILLGIALANPRWGEHIGTQKRITPPNALVLSASIAKTVELSFVTVFVALLGQILSRRAVSKTTRSTSTGISIAEMNMRSWIMQPGTLVTRWSSVRYAAMTILGVMAIIAAISATLYITACEALVSPKLRFSPQTHRNMTGTVAAGFANSIYLRQKCETPLLKDDDPPGDTCVQIEHAGQSFNNLYLYQSRWFEYAEWGNISSTSITERPAPLAQFYDNTTALGQWIRPSHENITTDSASNKRLVQNVTMAMPHTNVFHAARHPKSCILQPDDLGGSGEYFIKASVPAPAVNVLCVGLSTEELEPFIYANLSLAPAQGNTTAVDDFFHFGEKFGDQQQPVPYFEKAPIYYNTVTNFSNGWGPEAVYLLATPPANAKTDDHVLCSIRAMMYSNCATNYHAAESGGELSVHCDQDPIDKDSYIRSAPSIPSSVPNKDWKDVGSEWIRAVALNNGVSDANASIARLVTQSIPTMDTETQLFQLDPTIPSIGEVLSVLVGCTLLVSAEDAPFYHYWNHSSTIFDKEHRPEQVFQAVVSFKDYFSGRTQPWQKLFFIVLFAIFLLNCFALVYLTWSFSKDGQVTDYTEPTNLFALAINSPPSTSMSGACGAGPSGKALGKKWQVDMEVDDDAHSAVAPSSSSTFPLMKHPHFYIKCPDDDKDMTRMEDSQPPLKKKQSLPASMRSVSVWSNESPAVEQFKRLNGI